MKPLYYRSVSSKGAGRPCLTHHHKSWWNGTKWMRWVWRNGGMKFVVGENGRNPAKNLPRPRFVHHETHMEWPRYQLKSDCHNSLHPHKKDHPTRLLYKTFETQRLISRSLACVEWRNNGFWRAKVIGSDNTLIWCHYETFEAQRLISRSLACVEWRNNGLWWAKVIGSDNTLIWCHYETFEIQRLISRSLACVEWRNNGFWRAKVIGSMPL